MNKKRTGRDPVFLGKRKNEGGEERKPSVKLCVLTENRETGRKEKRQEPLKKNQKRTKKEDIPDMRHGSRDPG